jgi:hypothetical protein
MIRERCWQGRSTAGRTIPLEDLRTVTQVVWYWKTVVVGVLWGRLVLVTVKAVQGRRQHFEAIANSRAGVAAESCDRIELGGIDMQPIDVDDVGMVVRKQDLAHDDLP